LIGPRFVVTDLDVLIVRDVTQMFSRTEDFLISGAGFNRNPYNGSLVMMDAGARRRVFDEFSVSKWRKEKKFRGYVGGEDVWIAIMLGEKEATWTRKDGLICYRDAIAPRYWAEKTSRRRAHALKLGYGTSNGALPNDARFIQMNGPWKPETARELSPWV